MRLKALRPWYNKDHEGSIEPGQEFEANEYRANDLIRSGLAIAVVPENQKIAVPHDEPAPQPAPPPQPQRPQPTPEPAHATHRQSRTLHADDPMRDDPRPRSGKAK